MENPREKLCEICKENRATVYMCNSNSGKSQELCETCFEVSLDPEHLALHRQFSADLSAGKCSYCGAKSVGGAGGGASLANIPSLESFFIPVFWCEQCAKDLAQFAIESGMKDFLSERVDIENEEEIHRRAKELEKFKLAENEFLRKKISERG